MDEVTPQHAAGFKPLSVYEKPEVFLAQLMEGELSLKSAMALAFDSDKLTPKERTNLESYLLKGHQSNGAVRAAVGVATNPLTWLYLATGSAGANLATKGVALFGRGAKGATQSLVGKHPGLLASADLLTGSQLFHQFPAVQSAVKQGIRGIKQMHEEYLTGMGDLTDKLQKRHGLYAGIDANNYPAGSRERALAKEITTAIFLRSNGMHKDWVEKQASGKARYLVRRREEGAEWGTWTHLKDEADGKRRAEGMYADAAAELKEQKRAVEEKHASAMREWLDAGAEGEEPLRDQLTLELRELRDLETRDKVREALVDEGKLKQTFDRIEGLEEWFQANQAAVRQRQIRLYGKEGLGHEFVKDEFGVTRKRAIYKTDEQKLQRLFGGMSSELWKEATLAGGASDMAIGHLEGRAMVAKMFGPEFIDQLAEVSVDGIDMERRFMQKATELIDLQMGNAFYMPRNAMKGVDQPGIKASKEQLETMDTYGGHLDPSDATIIPRVEEDPLFDIDDVEYIGEKWSPVSGATSALKVEAKRAVDGRASHLANGTPLFVRGIDGGKSWDRYIADTSHVWAFHIQEGSNASLRSLQDQYQRGELVNSQKSMGRPSFGAVNEYGDLGRVNTRKGSDVDTRLGSFSGEWKRMSVGQLIDAAYQGLPQDHLQRALKSTILPSVTRRGIDNQHLISLGQFSQAKRAFRWLADTDAIKGLSKVEGDWGYRLQQRMTMLGDDDFRGFGGAGMATGLAKYLYGTHLGLNLGTMSMNMMQPFLLAGTALGMRNVLPAYADAAKEMAKYSQLRLERFGG